MATELASCLVEYAEVDLLTTLVPRDEFLARIASATICIFLPIEREGFFLPPLEAMALGRGVITPDCYGNRGYCRDGENCLMPSYSSSHIAAAAIDLVTNREKLRKLAGAGKQTATLHSLEKERSAYHTILRRYLR
jgi:glycosyltransferase involved in cell wall biosynthesis